MIALQRTSARLVATAVLTLVACDDANVSECPRGGTAARDAFGTYCVYRDDIAGGVPTSCPSSRHRFAVELSSGLVCADHPSAPDTLPADACALLREGCAPPPVDAGPTVDARPADGGGERDAGEEDAGEEDARPMDAGDAGPSDMGPTVLDTGPTETDMGPPPMDMGPLPMDVGPPVDMGPPPLDMGLPDLGCVAPSIDCGGVCMRPSDLATNADHCGRCGHDCSDGTCLLGECQPFTLATTLVHPWNVAIDDEHLYYGETNAPGGAIGRVELDGPRTAEPIASSLGAGDFGIGIAVSSTHLYWANIGTGIVYRTPKDTGLGSDNSTAQCQPRGIAIDEVGGYVYWANRCLANSVVRANLDLSGETPIASGLDNPYDVAVDDDGVLYFSVVGMEGTSTGSIQRYDGSGPAMAIATGRTMPHYLAVSGGFVYWVERATTVRIARVATTGGMVETVAAPGAVVADPRGIAADATGVYASDYLSGTVYRLALDGSDAPEVLAMGQQNPSGIVIGDGFVYWANFVNNALTDPINTVAGVALP